MRILVASWYVRPGFSGGWTTVLDLLQPRHVPAFLVAVGPEGNSDCEGVRVTGLPRRARLLRPWPLANRIRLLISGTALRGALHRAFEQHGAALVLCLDELMARGAMEAGLPYALRLHSCPSILERDAYRSVVSGALFATGSQPGIPGTVYLPHAVDLGRFEYAEPPRAEAAIMPTSLVEAEEPELFVKGVQGSSLRGTIVGDGPLREAIASLCRASSGKVVLHPAVGRSRIPSLLSLHQIGVACLRQGWHTRYQMKVTEYQASGLFPLVQPWSELAERAPDLTRTFRNAPELSDGIDWVAANWEKTLETRRRNREFARANYDIESARNQLESLLERVPSAT
ncbi:hypothetical protein JW921_02520 [Candidatus Fermentibacterales bacterium]|nr:hypothetical protein [Candidatus Fermentibacterales bacterium]